MLDPLPNDYERVSNITISRVLFLFGYTKMEGLIQAALVEHLDSALATAEISIENGISAEALTIIISETKSYVNTSFVGLKLLIPSLDKQRTALIAIYIYHYIGKKLNIADFATHAAVKTSPLLPSLAEIIIHFIGLLDENVPTNYSTPDIPMSPITHLPPTIAPALPVKPARKTRTNESSKIKALLGMKSKTLPDQSVAGGKSKPDLTHHEELDGI